MTHLSLVALLALVVPPLGVLLSRGMGAAFIVVVAPYVVSLGVYFGLYAGPGLALYAVTMLVSVLLALFAEPPSAWA